MYLHNYFPHLRPKFLSADGRTISWDHLKTPNINWVLIDDLKSAFLLTAAGLPAVLTNNGSGGKKWVVEPDKVASTRAMAHYLSGHHVSSMAAPGVDGCGEPCLCGGHASKHVTGKACDLSGLEELGHKIRALEPGRYSHRPTTRWISSSTVITCGVPSRHEKGKARELWHVEALPTHVPKPSHPHHGTHAHHRAVHARVQKIIGC